MCWFVLYQNILDVGERISKNFVTKKLSSAGVPEVANCRCFIKKTVL